MIIIKFLFVLMLVLPFAALLGYLIMKMAVDFNESASNGIKENESRHKVGKSDSKRNSEHKIHKKHSLKRNKRRSSADNKSRTSSRKKNMSDKRKTVYTNSSGNDFSSYPKDPYADFKRPDFDKQIRARMKNNE